MNYTIDDKVILTFSAERLENEIFQAADGLIATVVERYSQSHLPGINFYEVELDKPVADQNGRRIVTLSGLMETDLQPANVAEKINPKYLTKNAKAMKDEIKKHAHKDEDDASAYTSHPSGGWKADYDKSGKPYKTKMSSHTKKFKEMFGESAAINEGEVDKALSNKSEKTGIAKGILKKVYNRGLAAWRTGHRPGVSQHQWAMARVNSFATKGKGTWGKADKDLAKKVRSVNEKYDPVTGLFSMDLASRDFSLNYKSAMPIPAALIAELKKRFPDWDEEEDTKLVDYGIENKPRFEIEEVEAGLVRIYYGIELDYSSTGIDNIYGYLKRVDMILNFIIWDNRADDRVFEWEIEISDTDPTARVDIGSMPIVPDNLEIDVPVDLDPKKFNYTLQLGE
jgi:Family of unknown function (DUF5824)